MQNSSHLYVRNSHSSFKHFQQLVVSAISNSEPWLLFLPLRVLDVVPFVLVRNRRHWQSRQVTCYVSLLSEKFSQQYDELEVLISQMDQSWPSCITLINRNSEINKGPRERIVFAMGAEMEDIPAFLNRGHFQVEEARIIWTDLQQILQPLLLSLEDAQMVRAQPIRIILVRIIPSE